MTIKIVTDSSVQLTPAEQTQYQIHIAPLTIQYADETYIDGQTITREAFLEQFKTATTSFPTTSQPTVGSLVALYDQLGADGSLVLSIHCTGLLSGTVEGAYTAAQQSKSKVHVVDSKAMDRGLAYQVIAAAQDAADGLALDAILAHLDRIRAKTETYVFLDSLDALQRGGRISRVAGLLTKLIKLKVVVKLTDSQLAIVAKGRGNKAFKKVLTQMADTISQQTLTELAISHVGVAETELTQIQSILQQGQPTIPYTVALTSPVIMSHVGLKAFGIIYQTK